MSKSQQSSAKVIARLRDGKLIKGFLNGSSATLDAFQQASEFKLPELIGIDPVEPGEGVSLRLDTLKALFFVKSFEGKKEYPEVKFFDKSPPIRGLWVRIQFYDSESIEGTVENTIHYLVEPGFFMKPPDPQSNNQILYVIKSSLINFHILGVMPDY
jgi:hypothetical protein